MKRFLTTKGLIGLALIVLIVAVGVVAPFMIPASSGTRMQMALRLKPPTFGHAPATSPPPTAPPRHRAPRPGPSGTAWP